MSSFPFQTAHCRQQHISKWINHESKLMTSGYSSVWSHFITMHGCKEKPQLELPGKPSDSTTAVYCGPVQLSFLMQRKWNEGLDNSKSCYLSDGDCQISIYNMFFKHAVNFFYQLNEHWCWCFLRMCKSTLDCYCALFVTTPMWQSFRWISFLILAAAFQSRNPYSQANWSWGATNLTKSLVISLISGAFTWLLFIVQVLFPRHPPCSWLWATKSWSTTLRGFSPRQDLENQIVAVCLCFVCCSLFLQGRTKCWTKLQYYNIKKYIYNYIRLWFSLLYWLCTYYYV